MDEKKVESIIFGLKATIAEKDKEIERLTEEANQDTVTHIDICTENFSLRKQNAELQKQVDELKELSDGYFKKAYFYYQKCKAYGIENFYDDELEPKPAKEGKTITFPKFEHIEVE